jgi:hypothetical protein
VKAKGLAGDDRWFYIGGLHGQELIETTGEPGVSSMKHRWLALTASWNARIFLASGMPEARLGVILRVETHR